MPLDVPTHFAVCDELHERYDTFSVQTDLLGMAELWSVALSCLCINNILWAVALLSRPRFITLTQQLFSGKTEFLLSGSDENCTVGQGLACHFNTALCTLHGFNVCAAGLVLRSPTTPWKEVVVRWV